MEDWKREIVEKRTGLKLRRVAEGEKHQVGKKYYSYYWGKVYEVIEYTENTGCWMEFIVTVKDKDGIRKHCTSLREDDFEIME